MKSFKELKEELNEAARMTYQDMLDYADEIKKALQDNDADIMDFDVDDKRQKITLSFMLHRVEEEWYIEFNENGVESISINRLNDSNPPASIDFDNAGIDEITDFVDKMT